MHQNRESKQLYITQKQTQGGCQIEGQRNMAQMKEKNKTPEKELNETKRVNLSDAKFKTLVIKMLKEFIEHGNSIKEEMKVTLSEIKKNLQGTNSEEKEASVQINNLEHKEEINSQPVQNEERRMQKKMR